MLLKENEVCPLASQCPYNVMDSCYGARSNRKTKFTCDYVKNGKILKNQQMRIPQDRTGRMKVLME